MLQERDLSVRTDSVKEKSRVRFHSNSWEFDRQTPKERVKFYTCNKRDSILFRTTLFLFHPHTATYKKLKIRKNFKVLT